VTFASDDIRERRTEPTVDENKRQNRAPTDSRGKVNFHRARHASRHPLRRINQWKYPILLHLP